MGLSICVMVIVAMSTRRGIVKLLHGAIMVEYAPNQTILYDERSILVTLGGNSH